MDTKNAKTKEVLKVNPPPLIQEADELRASSEHVSIEAHSHAGIANLFELIISDPALSKLKTNLMAAFKSEASVREDPYRLAKLITNEAAQLKMHPVLLATAMIWWEKGADQFESESAGSADWQLLPMPMQNRRTDLQQEFRALAEDIEAIFRGSGLEPELAVDLIRRKCDALNKGLITLQKSIKGHRAKRKKLFYTNSKNEARAYYLLRVRGLKTPSPECSGLLAEAGEKYDLSDSAERKSAQQKLHSWAASFESLVDALMLDLGFERRKRTYEMIEIEPSDV